MPDTSCPRCGRAGFVRKERIIKANSATVGHYCGGCQFEWAITDGDVTVTPALRNRRARVETPRSHAHDGR